MITDQMVERAAKVVHPFAWEKDDDGLYTYGQMARDEAMHEARAILTAALGDAVVVPRAEYDNTLSILKKLDAQIRAVQETIIAAKTASTVTRQKRGDTTDSAS